MGSRAILFDAAPALARVKKLGWMKNKQWKTYWAGKAHVSLPTIRDFINGTGPKKHQTVDMILKPLGLCAADVLVSVRPRDNSPPPVLTRTEKRQLIPA